MPIGLSLYLDLVRFAAALTVFLFHLGYGKLVGNPFNMFVQFGEPAVIVFFVLSGFVISYVRASREQTLASFAIARLSRIYSVAIPALLLTAGFDLWGSALNPDLYPIPLTFEALLRCLSFTNEIGGGRSSFGSAQTFWSLGWEVWYYVMFAIATFATSYVRILLLILCAAIVGINILAFFPVWLLGIACYSFCTRARINQTIGGLVFSLPVVVFGVLVYFDAIAPIAHGLGTNRQQMILTYAIALLFSAHVIGAYALSNRLLWALRRLGGPIRWLAGTTFTLYLLHLPIAFLIRSNLPWDVGSWKSMVSILVGTLAVSFLVAGFTEKRKDIWRRAFSVPVNGLARLASRQVG